MNIDILIKNALILPDPGHSNTIDHGFIAIRDGVILLLDDMQKIPADINAKTTIDAKGSLTMPGLVNCHCHGAMTLFRGLADDLPLMEWLNEHIFPAESKFVNKEMVYWCTMLAAAEMVMSGTTTVADGYFFEEEAARAYNDIGMRAVAAQGIIDFPAPGVPEPANNIAYARDFLEKWQHNDLVNPAIFCHSPYTCSPQTLQHAKELAINNNCLFFIHVAETKQEVSDHQEKYGMSPIQHLDELNILDSKTVCVHCVWLDDADIEILQDSEAKVVTCPESNMKLASGVAPVEKMLKKGITLGLGTDGCASNNDLDLMLEMDSLAKIHKVMAADPTAMPAKTVLKMATTGGAEALDLGNCGKLAEGMTADLIIIDLNQPHLTPFHNPDLLVYAAKGSDVQTSIINGQVVMQDRVLCNFDLEVIMDRVRKMRNKKFCKYSA